MNKMIASTIIYVMLSCAVLAESGQNIETIGKQLALELTNEYRYEAAAIEYRRLAMHAEDADKQAGYYWISAYEYINAGMPELAEKMLDRSEECSQQNKNQSLLLRAKVSALMNNPEEAQFYLNSLLKRKISPKLKTLASREMAAALVMSNNPDDAEKTLLKSPEENDTEIAALRKYRQEKNKSPRIAGALGMVPGLGYMYSGEYANALRSLILNGIFIFGMIETADDEDWGAFTVISFFELTWYTGSIYGGIDSAHRYNRKRLNACLSAIRAKSAFDADIEQVPAISLKFLF